MMLFQPCIHLKGKTCCVKKKFFSLCVADDVGMLVKKIVPLSSTRIKIDRLLGKGRVSRFQGQKGVVMPASLALDTVSAGANNHIRQNSGGVVGVTKPSVIRQLIDLRVGEISVDDRPQVLNLAAARRFRRDAIFGQ